MPSGSAMRDPRRIRRWPGPEYHLRVVFDAPSGFVYSWCTDYSPIDARLEGEPYTRKVLERTPDRVVYEDVEEAADGFHWARYDVELRPPTSWRMTSLGNRRMARAEYHLTRLPRNRTRLDLFLRRIPGPLPGRILSKTEREADLARMWLRFKSALERDYRRGLRTPTPRIRRSSTG